MTVALALVTIGAGGVGAVIRYLLSLGLARVSDAEHFPWAVLVVNVVGSAIGGIVLGMAQHDAVSADLQLILLTGLCGGITTFSTFSVETIQLVAAGRWRAAALSVGANLVLGLGACALAFLLAS
ncbi:MAG TPA: fluoride efflux transporter CrcB [Terrimesophilobacter sp.]|nr:fluoride efflux transporter CrcB [Terrimesophilobacter sp.]